MLSARFVAAGSAVLALGAVVSGGYVYRAWKRRRISPEERERRRRAALVERGKITDANLVEIGENALFYSYLVRGVEYIASQDVTALREHMPTELGLGAGPVSVKYNPKNPANSIVLAEQWSGLRTTPLRPAAGRVKPSLPA